MRVLDVAAPVTLFSLATGLAAITTIVDGIVILQRQRAGHVRASVGLLSRATDLLLLMWVQWVIAGLTLVAMLATTPTPAVLAFSAILLSGSVLVLIALGAWLGISNRQRERHGITTAAPPILSMPLLSIPPKVTSESYRALAALVAQRRGVAPTWLTPTQTDQQTRQSIQAVDAQIAQRVKKLSK